MSASPAVRGVRAAVFAAVCVLLAAAGHGLAMGDMPPLWADGAAFLVVLAIGGALAGRERSLPGIGAAMLLTQAGLHLAFDAAHAVSAHVHVGTASAHAAVAAAHPAGASAHAASRSATAAHVVAVVAHVVTAHATGAHLVVALVASWWLWRGEAAAWSLLRRAGALVPGLVAWWRGTPLPAPAGLVPRTPGDFVPRRRTPLRHAVHRRGPPVLIPYSL